MDNRFFLSDKEVQEKKKTLYEVVRIAYDENMKQDNYGSKEGSN